MKKQLKVSEEINENLEVLFEELEEKREFAFLDLSPEQLEEVAKQADKLGLNGDNTLAINSKVLRAAAKMGGIHIC